ncbi:metallophosphoesterase [Bosea sp. (in: a-proteobacteria)]|uniref:metallophosphoesterase n=1 Tax=Bosea sp. (in: a-proteobacteria) TaxID=1871050 RepID=UPI0025C3FB08|nr:metallophosphoesterase [Bosea sp. (in: a-proteobacteria)]MBR3194527.1 metallophosphoesterase [Bosea sp. (in: a-proteobacteria)]
MKILVLSDLHIEFLPDGYRLPPIVADFDAVVLAGDIYRPLKRSLEWIARERDAGAFGGRPVIFVPGNHEFYKSHLAREMPEADDLARTLGISLLAPGATTIGGVRFIGATLWTDYALNGDARFAKMTAQADLNDHRLIRFVDGTRSARFTPSHAEMLHRRDLAFIVDRLEEPYAGPTVVVTHHAPHPRSVAERYAGQPLTAAFASNLSAVIDRHQPELWIHGHDHGSHDYMVGRTRILANQAGYPTRSGTQENPDFNSSLVIQI